MDTETFYPTSSDGGGWSRKRAAMRVCGRCPVAAECLDEALRIETVEYDRHGIWGGTTPKQRGLIGAARAYNGGKP